MPAVHPMQGNQCWKTSKPSKNACKFHQVSNAEDSIKRNCESAKYMVFRLSELITCEHCIVNSNILVVFPSDNFN